MRTAHHSTAPITCSKLVFNWKSRSCESVSYILNRGCIWYCMSKSNTMHSFWLTSFDCKLNCQQLNVLVWLIFFRIWAGWRKSGSNFLSGRFSRWILVNRTSWISILPRLLFKKKKRSWDVRNKSWRGVIIGRVLPTAQLFIIPTFPGNF